MKKEEGGEISKQCGGGKTKKKWHDLLNDT
jgi:hypothetical protein